MLKIRILRHTTSIRVLQRTNYTKTIATTCTLSSYPQPNQTTFSSVGINNDLYAEVGGVRVRQHVNPLKRELQVLPEIPNWNSAYKEPTLPLVLDVGCGYGRFLLALKHAMPNHNMLGLEIRQPIIDRANKWAESLNLSSGVLFVMANATISLRHLLDTYPGELDLVTVQYPDPHFKKRHHKRRIVQQQLVEAVAALLKPGGRVLLQSDVLEVAEDMRNRFEQEAGVVLAPCSATHTADGVFFEASPPKIVEEGSDDENAQEQQQEEDPWQSQWQGAGWLKENPIGVPTERELHTLAQGKPVYRLLLRKSER